MSHSGVLNVAYCLVKMQQNSMYVCMHVCMYVYMYYVNGCSFLEFKLISLTSMLLTCYGNYVHAYNLNALIYKYSYDAVEENYFLRINLALNSMLLFLYKFL